MELPYLHEIVQLIKTNTGVIYTSGLNMYEGVSIRNNVICKVDMLTFLVGEIMTAASYEEYRDEVLAIAANLSDNVKLISEVLKTLYLKDAKFQAYLGELFYFRKSESTLLQRVIHDLSEKLCARRDEVWASVSRCGYKYIAENEGYLYFAVRDNYDDKFLPSGIKGEVVSCAKVWNGLFKEREHYT